MRVARPVVLTAEQRRSLEQQSRSRLLPARVVERARIVLLAATGLQDKQIAAKLNITSEKVARWRKRFLEGGQVAMEKDAPRAGRPRTITAAKVRQVIEKTGSEMRENAKRWSTRTMAAAVGLSEASVRRIWRGHGLTPHLADPPEARRRTESGEEPKDGAGLSRSAAANHD